MTINEALKELDPFDDAQWTSDGSPLVDVVRGIMNDDTVTRKQITEAAPRFTRDAVKARLEAETEPETEPAEPEAVSLDDKIKRLDQAINDCVQKRDELQVEIDKLIRQRRGLQEYAYKARTPQQRAADIKAYQKRQFDLRMERHTRAQELRAAGLRAKDLDPRSPLDRALRHKAKSRQTQPIPAHLKPSEEKK